MQKRLSFAFLTIACAAVLLGGCKKDGASGDGNPCATANVKNATPPFCMTAPAGFKQGTPSGNFFRVDLPSMDGVALSWQPNASAGKPAELAKSAGDNKLIAQGDTAGGKGKWIVYQEKGSETQHIEALVAGPAFTIRCADNGSADRIKEGIAMCKTVAPM